MSEPRTILHSHGRSYFGDGGPALQQRAAQDLEALIQTKIEATGGGYYNVSLPGGSVEKVRGKENALEQAREAWGAEEHGDEADSSEEGQQSTSTEGSAEGEGK